MVSHQTTYCSTELNAPTMVSESGIEGSLPTTYSSQGSDRQGPSNRVRFQVGSDLEVGWSSGSALGALTRWQSSTGTSPKSWLLPRSSSLRKVRLPKDGKMHPEMSKEFTCSETALSGCRRPQETPVHLQKWLDAFHDASKPCDRLDSMDLKERRVSSSAEALLLPQCTEAWEQRHNNERQSTVINPSMDEEK
jgi:hypothetical protein